MLSVLSRLGLDIALWCELIIDIGKLFYNVAGRPDYVERYEAIGPFGVITSSQSLRTIRIEWMRTEPFPGKRLTLKARTITSSCDLCLISSKTELIGIQTQR